MPSADPRIIALKCPNCSGSDCRETGTNTYQCNFCKTTFIYREDVPEIVNKETRVQDDDPLQNKKTLVAIVATVVGIAFAFLLVFLFTMSNKKKHSPPIPKIEDPGYINCVTAALSKDKILLWYYKSRDIPAPNNQMNKQFFLDVVDPATQKSLKKIILFETSKPYEENMSASGALSYMAGKCWVASSNALYGIDAVTLEEVENNNTLERRHSELSKGIIECSTDNMIDYRAYGYFFLTTKDGQKYIYKPSNDTVFVDETDFFGPPEKTSSTEIIKTYFVFQLEKKESKNVDPLFGDYTTIRENTNKPKELWKRDDDKKQNTNLTPGKSYYFPMMHYWDNQYVIYSYLNDADEKNSPRIIQCLDANTGRVIWTCAEEEVQKLDEEAFAHRIIGGSGNQRQILFYSNSTYLKTEENRAVAIDLNTGKILYVVPAESRHNPY